MEQDQTGRQVVDVRLSADLVRHARRYTPDLSATLEGLLAAFVDQQRARHQPPDAALEQTVAALGAFHETYGLLSDEFTAI